MDNLNDLYESGLDEPTILNNYGEDIYDAVIEGLKDVNVKADSSIGRKKKPFVSIVNRLNSILGLSTIKLGKAHEELEKYLFFKSAYDNFIKIWDNQMKDIYNIPDKFNFGGVWMTSEEYSEFVKTKYFNCTSATKDYPIILEFLINKYKYEGVFLTTIYYNKNKLPKQDKYYTDVLGLKTIDEAYEHFLTKINEYPKEIIDEAKMYSKDPYCENMKNGFSKFTGFYLNKVFDTFKVPERVYGNITDKAERIFKRYESDNNSLGVLLLGRKGSGKTLGLLGVGGALGWKANEANQDMNMGQQIRRQQGM
jgi:hypothetical protein